ncbi:MAG: hypothetical protein ACXWZI_02440 [Mycobacterium sp.]
MADSASETRAYIRGQVAGAALVNAALNPLIEWGLNRSKGFQPLWGSDGVVLNMMLTSIILSALVALFTARGVHHQLAAGRIAPGRVAPALARLPSRAGRLGLLLGVGAAAAAVLVFWLLDAIGVAGMPFWGLLVLKAGYCGVLGGVVAWCVMLRLLGNTA